MNKSLALLDFIDCMRMLLVLSIEAPTFIFSDKPKLNVAMSISLYEIALMQDKSCFARVHSNLEMSVQ